MLENPISVWKNALVIGVLKEPVGLDLFIGDTDIAMVACHLYTDALVAAPSKTMHKTGVNHFHKFTKKYPTIPSPRSPKSRFSNVPFVFFAAYLFELDCFKPYHTVRNYLSHVTQVDVKKA